MGGFKAGDGVVRSKRITRTVVKAPGENTAQALDVEALLNSGPSQPGCEDASGPLASSERGFNSQWVQRERS